LALLFVALVSSRADHEQQLAVPVLMLVLALTSTPALGCDGPRSQSAGKHIDLVSQIRSQHALISTSTSATTGPRRPFSGRPCITRRRRAS
jgi:hypothetical protein